MRGDKDDCYLALVDYNLNLIHQLEISNEGLCLQRLNETHIILGQRGGVLALLEIKGNNIIRKCEIKLNNDILCI